MYPAQNRTRKDEQHDYTSRQRVLDTLGRREPDRIPFDLGSSIETGMTAQAYQGLIELLGLTEEPDETLPDLFLTAAGIAQIPENILRQLKVDVRGALIQLPSEPEPEIGFENETTLVYHDEWGINWAKPPSSLYMDPVGAPLKGELTAERLASHPWPNPDQEGRYIGLRQEVERLRNTGCAVMFSLYGLGIFDMALMIHGIEETLMDMAANPAAIEDLFGRITEFQMRMWTNTLEILGDNVDVCLHSDDLGSQTTSMMSPGDVPQASQAASRRALRSHQEEREDGHQAPAALLRQRTLSDPRSDRDWNRRAQPRTGGCCQHGFEGAQGNSDPNSASGAVGSTLRKFFPTAPSKR